MHALVKIWEDERPENKRRAQHLSAMGTVVCHSCLVPYRGDVRNPPPCPRGCKEVVKDG